MRCGLQVVLDISTKTCGPCKVRPFAHAPNPRGFAVENISHCVCAPATPVRIHLRANSERESPESVCVHARFTNGITMICIFLLWVSLNKNTLTPFCPSFPTPAHTFLRTFPTPARKVIRTFRAHTTRPVYLCTVTTFAH